MAAAAATAEGDASDRTCTLEDLPVLVRSQILSTLGLEHARNLVSASPAYHQQYRHNRGHLFRHWLDCTLGSVATDAYAVHRTSLPEFADTRDEKSVRQFLTEYGETLSSTRKSFKQMAISDEEALAMASFQSTVVEPLMNKYADRTLAAVRLMEDKIQKGDHYNPLATPDTRAVATVLSQTEKLRISRGLYRFQLFCNLFGARKQKPDSSAELKFTDTDVLHLFFGLFEPWEVEEIICIYHFLKRRLEHIIQEVADDLDEECDAIKNLPDRISPADTEASLYTGTLSRGLRLMGDLISLSHNENGALVAMLEKELTHTVGVFMSYKMFSKNCQHARRRQHRSPRDDMQDRRDELPFAGDEDSYEVSLRPPQAWVWVWKATYSNLYGDYIEGLDPTLSPGPLREWGYAMWDRARIRDSTEAGRVFSRTINYLWYGNDPRDVAYVGSDSDSDSTDDESSDEGQGEDEEGADEGEEEEEGEEREHEDGHEEHHEGPEDKAEKDAEAEVQAVEEEELLSGDWVVV